jgi:cytoskeleton protein RodZ
MSRTMTDDPHTTNSVIPAAPERTDREPVVVRRQATLSVLIGLGASLLSGLYLWRGVDQGSTSSWVVGAVLAVIALFHLTQWIDARTPLLVADATGVRLRLGNVWHGLLWQDVARVTVRERQGLFRDGRVVVHPADEAALRGLGARSRRRLAANNRMYGAPFALPLGLTTVASSDDLGGSLEALAAGATVVEVVAAPAPAPEAAPDDGTDDDTWPDRETTPEGAEEAAGTRPEDTADTTPEPEPGPEPPLTPEPGPEPEPSPEPEPGPDPEPPPVPPEPTAEAADEPPEAREPVEPARPVRRAMRADITRPSTVRAPILGQLALQEPERHDATGNEGRADDEPDRPRGPRPRGNMSLVLGETPPPSAVEPEVAPEAVLPPPTTPEPAAEPVIGPVVAEARRLLGLSVDDLATRTRIRPHVIEAIEVDDFGPCAGDFYARGHLRALARVLGIDPDPLVERFEERYATAPINARRVFEAELAAGDSGAFRGLGHQNGPRWGGLIIAVLALVLVWTLAGLFLDDSGTAGEGDLTNGSSGSAAWHEGPRPA